RSGGRRAPARASRRLSPRATVFAAAAPRLRAVYGMKCGSSLTGGVRWPQGAAASERVPAATADVRFHVAINIGPSVQNPCAQSDVAAAAPFGALAIERAHGTAAVARIFLRREKVRFGHSRLLAAHGG